MEGPQREMTLDEWMAKLPDFHRANQELTTLRTRLDSARELLAWTTDELQDPPEEKWGQNITEQDQIGMILGRLSTWLAEDGEES